MRLMMKVKSVEIQAFKSYRKKEDGTFDFMLHHLDKPANFVSLYAPNGFGKTSFFDAVDYAITGTIGRYIRYPDLVKKNKEDAKYHNKQGEIQFLIRNKDASESLETNVSIHTTGLTNSFVSEYPKLRRGTCDYDFTKKRRAGSAFIDAVLLSQEAIDSFLRETNAKERYDKFVKNIGGFGEINNQRIALIAVDNDIQILLKNLNQSIDECESSLKKIEQHLNPIEDANKLIERLNQETAEPFSQFDPRHGQREHEALLSKLTVFRHQASNTLTIVAKKQEDAQEILINLLATQRKIERLSKKEREEKLVNEALGHVEMINKLSTEKSTIESELKKHLRNKETIEQYIRDLHVFVEHQNILRDLEHKQIDLETKLKIASASKIKNDQKLTEKRSELGNLLSSIEDKKEAQDAAKLHFSRLSELETEQEKLQAQLIAYNSKKIRESVVALEQNMKRVSALTIAVTADEVTSTLLKKHELNLLLDYQQKYLKDQLAIQNVTEELRSVKERLSETHEQSQGIQELLSLASDIIEHTKQSSCPVCQQKYENAQILKDRISSNPVLSDVEKNLTTELQNLQAKLISYQKQAKEVKYSFDERVQDHKVIFDLSYREALQDENKQQSQHAAILASINQNASLLKELRGKVLNKQEAEYKQYIVDQSNKVQRKIAVVKGEVELYEKSFNSSEQQLDKLNTEQSKLTISNDYQHKIAEPFDGLHDYLVLAGQSPNNTEGDLLTFFKEQLDHLQKRIHVTDGRKADIYHRITGFETLLAPVYRGITRDNLIVKLEALVSEIGKIRSDLSSFEDLLQELELSQPQNTVDWNLCREHISDYVNQLESESVKKRIVLNEAGSLEELSLQALKFQDPKEFEQRLSVLNQQRIGYVGISADLKADVEKIDTYIRSKTNAYFKTDLINQLYAAIDPHPEFKKIHFECKVDGQNKFGLYISAIAPNTNDEISPTLTFSSAQINVLALSIFLAQALTAKDDKGNDVECIFIDDPVQSVDSINSLSFIDLVRAICLRYDKQIILSTHDENFHELLRKKIPPNILPAKYLRLASFGKVVND